MIPLILGLGGLAAKVAAAGVIPHIVRAISRCIPTTTPTRPPEPVSVERISSGSDAPQTKAKWGVSLPQPRSRKWGYAGLFHHGPSGLDLATYRTYDSTMGRWISRDPLGEGHDRTLYSYCGNSPINFTDPSGLNPGLLFWLAVGLANEAYNHRPGGTYDQLDDPAYNRNQATGLSEGATYQRVPAALVAAPVVIKAAGKVAKCSVPRGRGGTAGRAMPSQRYPIRQTILPTSGHHANQLNPSLPQFRGWTPASIDAAVNGPARTGTTINHATGNPATAYFNESGHYVVRDNVTGNLVQMSNQNFPIGSGAGHWTVDSNIQMNP